MGRDATYKIYPIMVKKFGVKALAETYWANICLRSTTNDYVTRVYVHGVRAPSTMAHIGV